MPVWDDINRDDDHASPLDQLSPASPVAATLDRGRAHDEVRAAVHKDAAEIIARARRDIRRVVGDARRELLELSAQVQAAEIELPDAALADPGLMHVEELVAVRDAGHWIVEPSATAAVTATEPEALEYRDVVPEDDEPVAGPSAHGAPLTSPGSARTFVALFTLAGVLVVAGTVWWLRRPPSAEAGVATATSPAPATSLTPPDPGAATPSAGGATPSAPPPVPRAEGLSVVIEAQRETWIRTTIDGESDAGRTFAPGEKRQVNAVNEVSIRAGDAGGVLVSVDGAPAAPFGPAGVSLTRRFTRAASAPRPAAVVAPAPSVAPPVVAALSPASPTSSGAPTSPRPTAPAAITAPQPNSAVPPPSVPAASTTPARGTTSGRVDISASGRQWLDAYHRQDRISMESLSSTSLVINDERRPDQRFPFGLEVTRAFEDEQLQLSGDSAMFTARMTERAATGARVSLVSQTWVRRLGAWQLQEARIAPEVQTPPPPR